MDDEEQRGGWTLPDLGEPAPERQAELREAHARNLALGRPPCAGVRIRTIGELHWIWQDREREVGGALAMDDLDLRGADLHGLDFSVMDALTADLTGANLAGASFAQMNLTGARFAGANLRGAICFEAGLSAALLAGADLSETVLYSADLTNADLRGADLQCAVLDFADLTGADLSGADLRGASFHEADLRGINGDGARSDEETNFTGITRDAATRLDLPAS